MNEETKNKVKNPRLGFRTTETFIEKVKKRADEMGLKPGQYLRMLVINDIEKWEESK